MTVLGVLAARRWSKRFPRKHHALLLGKPLIAYSIEAALDAQQLARLVISSDDPELEPLAKGYGVEFLTRPAELALDGSALEDAVRHACQALADRDGFDPDVVLMMQANLPVRKNGQVDDVIARFDRYPAATGVCTAKSLRFRPEWAKVVTDDATGEAASFLPPEWARSFRQQDYPQLYALDGAICGVRSAVLRDTAGNRNVHAWLGERLHLVVQDDPMYSLEIDYPDEVPLAEYYLQRLAALTPPATT